MTSGLTKAFHLLASFLSLVAVALVLAACGGPSVNAKANKPLNPAVVQSLAAMGSSPGEAMVIRIFKESSELEIWKRTRGGEFKLLMAFLLIPLIYLVRRLIRGYLGAPTGLALEQAARQV